MEIVDLSGGIYSPHEFYDVDGELCDDDGDVFLWCDACCDVCHPCVGDMCGRAYLLRSMLGVT